MTAAYVLPPEKRPYLCVPEDPCGHCDVCSPPERWADDGGLLAQLRTGAWLDIQHFPDVSYHLPGIVPEGYTLFVGSPKIGKSWFVLSLALACAAGGKALGLDVSARPVLYMALEDGDRRMQNRCRKLMLGSTIPADFQYMTRVNPDLVLKTIEVWLARYPDSEPLVILDTLGKVMPAAMAGESAYQRDYRVGSTLKAMIDEVPGSGLLVVHHDRKAGSDDFVEVVSGSNGLAGAADTVVVLNRPRFSDEGKLAVTGREIQENEYALKFVAGTTWTLDGPDLATASSRAAERRATEGLSDRSTEIVEFVARQEKGCSPKEVELALGLPDARRYMARLADSGRLVKVGHGLYVRPTHPTVPTVPVSQSTTTRGVMSLVGTDSDQLGQRDTWDRGGTCQICGGPDDHEPTTHAPEVAG